MISDEPQEWLRQMASVLTGKVIVEPCRVFGIRNRKGELIGVAVWNDFDGRNIELSVAGKGAWRKDALRALGKYAFEQLGCKRVTFTTKAGNTTVRALIERLGAKPEGLKRNHYDDDDAAVYGLLPDEYRFR